MIVALMLRARWGQAVTLFLLATVAVAAAVAGPVATRAADAAIARLAVEHATDRERVVSVISTTDPTAPATVDLLDRVAGQLAWPGFDVYRTGELQVAGPATDPAALARPEVPDLSRLVARGGVCDHLTIQSGRCLVGSLEVLLGAREAATLGVGPGAIVEVQAERLDDTGLPVPDGAVAGLTVVGVYQPTTLDDPYWAGQTYFQPGADGTPGEVAFTTATTLPLIGHTTGLAYLDAVAAPGTLTPQRLAGIDDEITTATNGLDLAGVRVATDLPDLASQVAASRALAGQLTPVAFVPLTLLSLFVIYLAVGAGLLARRPEIALVALRGVARGRRWLLAGGETLLPILVGAPVGYVAGHLMIGAVARLELGSAAGAGLSWAAAPVAAGTLLVALVAALVGQWSRLREPVASALRGVPPASARWGGYAAAVLVGVLAVVATVQVRVGDLVGASVLAPGLVVAAVALLAAWAVGLLAAGLARVALRRGWLGLGLATAHLARRPGLARLFVLLAVGTGLLAFVAAGTDVSAQARADRADVVTGAPRVLRVAGADARRLLAATHAADPAGGWAMAAVTVPPADPGEPTVLALDTARLAAVAAWRPAFGADPAAVAAALRPPTGTAPFEVHDDQVRVAAAVTSPAGSRVVVSRLLLDFVTLVDGTPVSAVITGLATGDQTVTVGVAGCAPGCRLVALEVPDAPPIGTRVVIEAVDQVDPLAEVVPGAALATAGRWRADDGTLVQAVAGQGLALGRDPRTFARPLRVGVLDAPLPVPVAVTGPAGTGSAGTGSAGTGSAGTGSAGTGSASAAGGQQITSLDGEPVRAQVAVTLAMLPRLGTTGALVDLNYLERTLVGRPGPDGEVWLGPAAPADAVERLRSAGLTIVGETSIADNQAALARQGPALALRFHLVAAGLGALLALGALVLVAAVDRRPRAADLRALRDQGLPRRIVRRATLLLHLPVAGLAGLAGLVGAIAAWAAAGDRIPVFADGGSVLPPPRWPAWSAVAQPWAVATIMMMVAALGASWALRVAVRSRGRD